MIARDSAKLVFLMVWLCLQAFAGEANAATDRPAPKGGPTTVRVRIFVIDVYAISSVEQSFTANVAVMARWIDPSLAHKGEHPLVLPLDDVWHPRLQVINRRKMTHTIGEKVMVSPDGEVTYRQRLLGSFSQRMDLRRFPRDNHAFEVQLIATGYGPDEVRLIREMKYPSGIALPFTVTDWTVTSWDTEPVSYRPLPGLKGRAGYLFRLRAQRKMDYFFWKFILPLIMIVVMSWLVFYINLDLTPTRMNLAVTSMLTLIAYRFMIGNMLPNVSYLTRLDYFVLLSTILVFLAMIEVVVTSSLHAKSVSKKAQRITRYARIAFPTVFVLSNGVLYFS